MSVDVEQDCAIVLLVDNVVLKDLVVQRSGSLNNAGHVDKLFLEINRRSEDAKKDVGIRRTTMGYQMGEERESMKQRNCF